MSLGFLDHMRVVPDHRIPGMVTYPLDEVLLATLEVVGDETEGEDRLDLGETAPAEAFLDALAQAVADRIAEARRDLVRDGGLTHFAGLAHRPVDRHVRLDAARLQPSTKASAS